MRMKTLAVLFFGYVAYVILGGGIFHYLESENENQNLNLSPPREGFDLQEILEELSGEHPTTTHATHLHSQSVTLTPGEKISEEEFSVTEGRHNITVDADSHLSCGHDGLSAVLESFRAKVGRVDDAIADLRRDMDGTGRCVRTRDIPLVVLSYSELESIVRRAAQAGRDGIDPVTGQQEQQQNTTKWDFQASLGFALTVVTTIGYGHISPASAVGRAVCVLYALFGIPFTAVLVTNIAHHVGDQVRKAALRVHKDHPKWSPQRIKRLTAITLLLLGVLSFVLLPALVIWSVEGWTFSETLYYVFISLSTIGFGDYVVGQQPEVAYWPGYVILIFVWILCGIEYLATIFELISLGIKGLDSRIGGPRKDGGGEGELEERLEDRSRETTV
ncbi:PREDICTED: potassium channel subfamily K member 10-like [Branchiostoma belcheri]|uniref:Potassium channel subfamily K member 10-like n=1 Tax=Branchiostoma belcheri TaxID=7741 RepID=A0A6P5AD84_BRABE|nr:PREDICTED: potassium channel subfamily K member 10-like [Branchiostoma belcheri]